MKESKQSGPRLVVIATEVTVLPPGQHVFDEAATVIRVVDDGGGAYLELEQDGVKLTFDDDEWDFVNAEINKAIASIRQYNRALPVIADKTKGAKDGGHEGV